jgi:hypothetical protein
MAAVKPFLGAAIVLTGGYAMWRSFQHGSFVARGHRSIYRKNHPVVFWANVVGLSVVCIIGLLVIGSVLTELF